MSLFVCLACVGRAAPPGTYQAAAWSSPFGTGLLLTTRHYRIYTTVKDQALLDQTARLLEDAHRAYNEVLPCPIVPIAPYEVYLLADRSQWEAFVRRSTGPQAKTLLKIANGAVCHQGVCIAYDIGTQHTLAALAHEGWHQFISRHFAYRLPSWLDEGMAMMFEGVVEEAGRFRFCPAANRYRIEALYRACQGRPMPLVDLLAASPGDVLATDQSDHIQVLYAQWYALVRFLRESKRFEQPFRSLLADAFWGMWPLDPQLKRIAADRNLPRTTSWNRVVGPYVFGYYICDESEAIQQQFQAFCRQLSHDCSGL